MEHCDVVVIGGLHHNTLGVIRSLGENKVLCIKLNVLIVGEKIKKKNLISVSKYVTKIDYVDCDEMITDWLLSLAQDGIKRTIICCSDGSAENVIKNNEKLKQYYNSPSTKINVEQLMDKQMQDNIAVECGLRVPFSKVFHSKENVEWNEYPCITKPLKSVSGGGKSDIHISNNFDELKEALHLIEADKVQIQQYISKSMEFQLIGCSLKAGDIIIIPGYTDLIRQPDNTNTGYLKYSPVSDLDFDMTSIYKFIKKIGYSGLFSIEFIRDSSGKDYFLEINMRNDGNAYCVQTAGVNLPLIWCYYQLNGILPEVDLTFSKSIMFIPDFNDLKVSLRTIGIIRWIRDFINAESHSIYNKNDMRPFINEITRLIRSIFGKE